MIWLIIAIDLVGAIIFYMHLIATSTKDDLVYVENELGFLTLFIFCLFWPITIPLLTIVQIAKWVHKIALSLRK